jgi:hypothetical protein
MHETPYEQRRARAFCLAGIVAVSACAGVLIGRYSAVIFPISSVANAPGEAQPQPSQQATSQPAGSLAEHLNRKSQEVVAADKDKPESNGQKASDSPKADDSTQKQSAAVENVEKDRPAAEQPEESKVGGATILNPGADQRTRDARRVMDDASRNDVPETQPKLSGETSPQNSECARRYASFRESDGTYQPYGSSQRKVCPLLR